MNEAIDAMMMAVRDALPVNVLAVWPDVPGETPTDTQWIRASVHHADGRQASLAGENGARKWRKKGVLSIQCFSPVGDGQYASVELADHYVRTFEAIRNSPIWYRNIRAIEVGKEGSSVQVNVMADFEYDDIH